MKFQSDTLQKPRRLTSLDHRSIFLKKRHKSKVAYKQQPLKPDQHHSPSVDRACNPYCGFDYTVTSFMQNPHGLENALSSGDDSHRTASEDTRNTKRLKTKHNTKKNTTTTHSGAHNDNNESDHTKNTKDKYSRTRSDSASSEQHDNSREKTANGNVNNGNDDNGAGEIGKKKQESMEKIEKDFTDLKEKFFKDKMAQLKKEVDTIKNGTHPQFCEQCKDLDDMKNEKIAAAEQWRQYQLQSINNMFEAERQQAEDECSIEKKQLKERLIHAILEKQKKISEDKTTMNIPETAETRSTTRQLRRRGGQAPPPPAQVKKKITPPSINYTLKDSEIQEDLNAIFNKRETRTR